MNTIYFHLIGGAAGDMLLVSLIELGCPLAHLKKEFKKLNIDFDVSLEINEATACHVPKKTLIFKGANFTSHKDIVRIIKNSRLDKNIKNKALSVYELIAKTESGIHRAKNIHYHHLGEIDAILEICGFFIALKYLNIENICVSVFPLSKPAPATIQLLRGKEVRVVEAAYESVTPTAAALLRGARQAEAPFVFKKSAVSFGNCAPEDYLTAYILEGGMHFRLKSNLGIGFESDTIIKIETNIDDMNPQIFPALFDELLAAGAKDVYLEQVIMKKGRPGFVLNVLCAGNNFPEIREIIFSRTSTFGLRYLEYKRDKLPYNFITRDTRYGKITFRVSRGKIKKEMPEYRDCLSAAKNMRVPLADIYKTLSNNHIR